MVVETNDIDGPTLEEMVVGIDLVTTGCDGTGSVITLDNLCQMTGEQRVDTQLAFLGQGRGIVTRIENQIGLLEGERIGLGIAPLFEYFVTNRPHED